MKKGILTWAALAILTTGIVSCSKSSDNNTANNNGSTGSTAKVSMHLTDDPASYEHVYIDIQKVEVTMQGSSAVTLAPIRPGIYDLLRFRNGADTLLLTANLPVGTVEQIRLVLGDNNSVVTGGQTYALTTPSGQTSGLKLNLNQTFAANGAYDVWIDFDAGKSIHETGNGKFMLKPVIRAYSALTNGRIKGYVLPLNALATVYAINGTDTFAAIPATDGFFYFSGLPAATYQVWVDAGVLTLQDTWINNVQVSYGVESNLGTITLVP